MGRHSAPGDTSVVSQAGEIGWPAPPHKGHGLGWPGDLSADGETPVHGGGPGRLLGTTPTA